MFVFEKRLGDDRGNPTPRFVEISCSANTNKTPHRLKLKINICKLLRHNLIHSVSLLLMWSRGKSEPVIVAIGTNAFDH